MRTRRKPTRAKQLGVTDAEYAVMFLAQGGHCALCPAVPKTRRLHVDHCSKLPAMVLGFEVVECDLVPDDKLYVLDLDALDRMLADALEAPDR